MCENVHHTSRLFFEICLIKGGECVDLVTRVHFRSHDKDGCDTIFNPPYSKTKHKLHANFMALPIGRVLDLLLCDHSGDIALRI